MSLPVTTLLASLLGLWFVFLSFRVIGHRRDKKVSLGDGGDATLNRAIRGHGNFAEYAPLTLILFALAEMQQVNIWLISLVALVFFAGRIAHGYAFAFSENASKLRVSGMFATLISIITLSAINLIYLAL